LLMWHVVCFSNFDRESGKINYRISIERHLGFRFLSQESLA
jgi:hypothetical protein